MSQNIQHTQPGSIPMIATASLPYIASPNTHNPKSRHMNFTSLDQTIQTRPSTPARSSSPVPPIEDLVCDCFLHSIGKLEDPSRVKMVELFNEYAAKTHITENLDFLVSLHEYEYRFSQGYEESRQCFDVLVTSLSDLNISYQICQDIINSQDRSPSIFAKAKKHIMQLLIENSTEFGSCVRKKFRQEAQTPQDSPYLSPVSPPFSPTFSPTDLRSNPPSIAKSKPRNMATLTNSTRSINNSNTNSADDSSQSSVSSTASFLGQLKIGKEAMAPSSSLKFWSRKK